MTGLISTAWNFLTPKGNSQAATSSTSRASSPKSTDQKSKAQNPDFFRSLFQEGGRVASEGAVQGTVRALDENTDVIMIKLKTIFREMLLVESPKELPALKVLLEKCLPDSQNHPTWEEIQKIHDLLVHISIGEEEDDELLKKLASRIPDDKDANLGKKKITQLLGRLTKQLESRPKEEREVAESKHNDGLDPAPSSSVGSDPVLSKKTQQLTAEVLKFVELLIYYNQGIVHSGTQAFQTFLSTLVHDQTGLLRTLERQLTDPNKGLLDKALNALKQKVGEQGGLLDTLSDGLNAQPHALLAQAKDALHAVINAAPNDIVKLSDKAKTCLADLRAHLPAIFVRCPLTEAELDVLADCSIFLADLDSHPGSATIREFKINMQKSHDILNAHFNKEEGLAPRTARVFMQTVSDKVSELPKKFMSHIQKRKEEKKANLAAGIQEEMTLWDYLIEAQEFLTDPKAKTSRGIGQCMLWVLRGIEAKIAKTPEYEQTALVVRNLSHNIEAAMENPKGMDLLKAVQQSLIHPDFEHMQFYLNGIKIPKIGIERKESSSIAAFIANIQNHESAVLQNPKKERTKVDYEKLIEEEQDTFTKKTTCFGTMKLVFWLTGTVPDDKFFSEVLKHEEDSLKAVFLKNVESLKTSTFSKWICKALFRVVYPFTSLLVGQFSKRFSKTMQNKIKEVPTEEVAANKKQSKEEQSVGDFSPLKYVSRSFSILQGAFERVANNPLVNGDLDEMIIEELERPEINKNMSSKELFQTVSAKFVEQFMPRIELSKHISKWLGAIQIPQDSIFHHLNNIVKGLTSVTSFIFAAILYVPEKLSNAFISFLLKKFALRTELFDTIIKRNLDALQSSNNYIHAFNSVVYEQLEMIWDLLQESVTKSGSFNLATIGDEQTKGQKKELTKLVKHMMQVLENSDYETPKELSKFINDKSTLQKLRESAESLFVGEAVDAASRLIGVAYKAFAKPYQMQKLFYHFLRSVNRSYSIGKSVTTAEFQTMERGINTLVSRILTLAIKLSLEKRFDFSLQSLQTEQRKFIDDIKLKTQEFADETGNTLMQVQKAFNDPTQGATLATTLLTKVNGATTLLTKVINSSLEFQRKRVSQQFQANANSSLDTETQRTCDKISYDLAVLCKELGTHVNEAVIMTQEIGQHDKNIEHFQGIQNILKAIDAKMQIADFDASHVTFCKNQFLLLQDRMNALQKVERLERSASILLQQKESLKDAFESWANIGANVVQIKTQVLGNDSVFSQLVTERKKACRGQHDKRKLARLHRTLVEQLKMAENPSLKRILNDLVKEKDYNSVVNLSLRFSETANQQMSQLQQEQDSYLSKIQKAFKAIDDIAQKNQQFDPNVILKKKNTIAEHLNAAITNSNRIAIWAKDLKTIGIINLPLVEMSWFIDIAKNIANDQIEQMVQKFLDFMHKRYNYITLIRHGLLVPYAKGF